MNLIEIFGYVSMIVVLVSVTMNDMRKLRITNTVACAMFVIYGVLMHAYPVVIMNICVIIINLYRLNKSK